jgi:hypothetical protein
MGANEALEMTQAAGMIDMAMLQLSAAAIAFQSSTDSGTQAAGGALDTGFQLLRQALDQMMSVATKSVQQI